MSLKNSSEKSYFNEGNEDVLQYIDKVGEVLDIGCGAGDNARILNSKNFIIEGITISNAEARVAKEFCKKVYVFNLENGLPEEVKSHQYDYIICSHILEHIQNPKLLLNDIYHSLKKSGKLIVALPNIFHYASRWQLVLGEFKYEESGIWDNTHVKWYSYQSGATLITEHNFKIIDQKVTGDVPLASLVKKILSQKNSEKLAGIFHRISPGLFGYQIIYVATKA